MFACVLRPKYLPRANDERTFRSSSLYEHCILAVNRDVLRLTGFQNHNSVLYMMFAEVRFVSPNPCYNDIRLNPD